MFRRDGTRLDSDAADVALSVELDSRPPDYAVA
jgi:hypothetical protein